MSKAQQPTNLLLDGELLRGIERAGLEDLRAAAAGANAILADWASGTGMGPLPGGTPAVEGAGDFEDELGALRQLLRTGTLNLQVRLLDDGAMNGAAVAYRAGGAEGSGAIFVNADRLASGVGEEGWSSLLLGQVDHALRERLWPAPQKRYQCES